MSKFTLVVKIKYRKILYYYLHHLGVFQGQRVQSNGCPYSVGQCWLVGISGPNDTDAVTEGGP